MYPTTQKLSRLLDFFEQKEHTTLLFLPERSAIDLKEDGVFSKKGIFKIRNQI